MCGHEKDHIDRVVSQLTHVLYHFAIYSSRYGRFCLRTNSQSFPSKAIRVAHRKTDCFHLYFVFTPGAGIDSRHHAYIRVNYLSKSISLVLTCGTAVDFADFGKHP